MINSRTELSHYLILNFRNKHPKIKFMLIKLNLLSQIQLTNSINHGYGKEILTIYMDNFNHRNI